MASKNNSRSGFQIAVIALLLASAVSGFAISEATGNSHLLINSAINASNCSAVGQNSSDPSIIKGVSGVTGRQGVLAVCDAVAYRGAGNNAFNLGTIKNVGDNQLDPESLTLQDQNGTQAHMTFNSGALIFGGVSNLQIGNFQLTTTGIKTLDPNTDITLGEVVGTGKIKLARELQFPDGTLQTTATLSGAVGAQGATGPRGATGSQGIQGATGPTGVAAGFASQTMCVEGSKNNFLMHLGTCSSLKLNGVDYQILIAPH